jgi:hypothetical protein
MRQPPFTPRNTRGTQFCSFDPRDHSPAGRITTVSDILDSNHLPIIFYLLESVKVRSLLKPIEKLSGKFRNIASELITPRLEINTGTDAETFQLPLLRRIGCRKKKKKATLPDVNTDLPA